MALSTYYDAKTRPTSARARSDALLGPALVALSVDNYCVYGAQLWKAARRAGHDVGRTRLRQNQCVSDSRVVAVSLLPSNVMAESLRPVSGLLPSGHTASGSRSEAPSSGASNSNPGTPRPCARRSGLR